MHKLIPYTIIIYLYKHLSTIASLLIYMRSTIYLIVFLIFLSGCLTQQDKSLDNISPISQISQISQDILPDNNEIRQLGIVSEGIVCNTEEYDANDHSSLQMYSFCNFTIKNCNDTEVIIELSRYSDLKDLNYSYQYNSLHLRSKKGLISEDDYGDQSRFSVNHEQDYGGTFDDPKISYYHLWICKGPYLIHITSKGSIDAKRYIPDLGSMMLEDIDNAHT